MRSQIAREALFLENKFVEYKKMGLIFSPVYQLRQYGCNHAIHTFTKKETK